MSIRHVVSALAAAVVVASHVVAAQVIDLIDSEAPIVGHNDNTGGLEHLVERCDELFLFSSFHLLSPNLTPIRR